MTATVGKDMIKFVLKIVVLLLIAMLASCANDIAGSGSEIVNGKLAAGTSGVLVEAVSTGYVKTMSGAEEIMTTFTDNNGAFSLKLDTGCYNLVIRDTLKGVGVFIPEVRRGDKLDMIELGELGSIEVTVESTKGFEYLVFIIGTPFGVIIDTGEVSLIDNVPPGSYVSSFISLTHPSPGGVPTEPYNIELELKPSDRFHLQFTD